MLLYAGYKECTVRLFAGMPVCYIYRQQEGRHQSEDALDAVCDRIAPRYGVELAGSRYAA